LRGRRDLRHEDDEKDGLELNGTMDERIPVRIPVLTGGTPPPLTGAVLLADDLSGCVGAPVATAAVSAAAAAGQSAEQIKEMARCMAASWDCSYS
jgi:hypothetical protein